MLLDVLGGGWSDLGGDGPSDQAFEQLAQYLLALGEVLVERRPRHARFLRDVLNAHADVAAFVEEAQGGVEDCGPSLVTATGSSSSSPRGCTTCHHTSIDTCRIQW